MKKHEKMNLWKNGWEESCDKIRWENETTIRYCDKQMKEWESDVFVICGLCSSNKGRDDMKNAYSYCLYSNQVSKNILEESWDISLW